MDVVKTASEPSASATRGLDRSLFQGIAWTAVWRWIAQAVSWLGTLYVARILTPGDYGLVAMAAIPIGFARLIEDLGLDAIILQDRSLNDDQLRRLAGAALLLGAGLTLLFLGFSIPISLYFREPQVAGVVCALSLTFILDSLQILPRALLQRDLQFRTLAWINSLQVSSGTAVMVMAAWAGMNYWSLVVNTILSYALVTVVLYLHRPFTPAWPTDLHRLTRSLTSGWNILVSRMAYYGYSSADSTIIGRLLGKDALGIFGFASTFAALPVREVTSLVSGVVPGVFTAVQNDRPALRRYFLLLTEAISILTLPAAFGLAITADDFVLLALGERWTGVIEPLRLMSIYMAVYSCQSLLGHVLMWTGHFSINMWLTLFALLVLPGCFYAGAQYNLTGVAIAWVIGFPLAILPGIVAVKRILGISWSQYSVPFRPAITGCICMLAAVFLVRLVLPADWHHGPRLGMQALTGVLAYIGVMWWLFEGRVRELYQIVLASREA